MSRLTQTREDVLQALRLWWLIALVGIVSAIAGAILVARPSHSLTTLAVVVGIFLLIDGVVELATSIGRPENRGLAAVVGVLGIVVGIALIRHPFHGVAAIGLVFGIWLVAAGVIRGFRAVVEGVHPLLRFFIGFVEICVGVVIVSAPHIGYTTLAVIGGIWLMVNGIAMIALGAGLRIAEKALSQPRPALS